jgi:protein SCO1
MNKPDFHILHSWKAALAALIVLPLLAYGMVHWTEEKYSRLPLYGKNNIPADDIQDAAVLPPFSFTDQDSIVVTNALLKGNIAVANFFFTSCPVVCPKMMQQLQRIPAADKSVVLLSFTVDPERDTPARMRQYAAKLPLATSRWKLLTGDKKALYYFARKGLYLVATDGDGGEDDFIHSDILVLLDKQQHIRGYYKGTAAAEVSTLLSDIKKLQHEQ